MIRLIFVLSIAMFLAGCATEGAVPKPVVVDMSTTKTITSLPTKQQRLQITVLPSAENIADFGGSNGYALIKFTGVPAWLTKRLQALHRAPCTLSKTINLEVSLQKLYMSNIADVLTGNVQLATRDGAQGQKKYYTGGCVADFFWSNQKAEIRSCLNRAMAKVIKQMKHDICRQP